MRRFALALLVVVVLASAADAVSVAIAPDKPFYLPGETVNLIVTVDATGGAPALQVGGTFAYDPSILLGGSMTQTPLTSFGGLPWTLPPSSVLPCGGGTCFGFGQILTQPVGQTADQGPGFHISTITFTAGAPGVTDILWTTVGPTALTFFGLTSAPGTSVEVVVPEPATAALLALGLCALSGVRSRR